ncbi:hypothetical protein DPMN_132863 [Dreissena polymorpha]|uniref:Uncharacterized protein n=1 Tax=Dreissena polymorpha TaxID=45954 RepID=A0A9D4J996_DREPO|nr:hypothetical protein DPMN_132863 [Dreissena polymorpha]
MFFNRTIFKLYPDIIRTNVLTKVYEDWTKHVVPCPHAANFHKGPKPFFELVKAVLKINVPTMFHEDLTMNVSNRVKTAAPPGSHFHHHCTIRFFELGPYIIWTNLRTKFHEDLTLPMASTVLTRKIIMKMKGDPNCSTRACCAEVSFTDILC